MTKLTCRFVAVQWVRCFWPLAKLVCARVTSLSVCVCLCVLPVMVQVLDAERHKLRSAATEVAELRARQQAAADEQHQQRQALQQTVHDLQRQVQQQEHQLTQHEQQRSELQAQLQRWQQQYAELQEQSRQQQDQGLQQLSERLREAVDQKQELQARLKAQLAELQQQLQDSNVSALQAAAEKAALTAQLASAEQAKGVFGRRVHAPLLVIGTPVSSVCS